MSHTLVMLTNMTPVHMILPYTMVFEMFEQTITLLHWHWQPIPDQ